MKKFFVYCSIFLISLLVIDGILSISFEKEVYKMVNNKLEIKPVEISRKQPEGTEFSLKGENKIIPYWENDSYRGPFFDYGIAKKRACRVLGIGDSIIYASGVGGKSSYFSLLQNKIENTEWINNGVPGHDTLQSIIKYQDSGLGPDTDLLIWHFRQDDRHIYKLVDGILYSATISLNDFGKPFLFGFQKIDSFLLKYSYMYNKVLKIKMKGEVNHVDINNEEYLVKELEVIFNNFLAGGKDKKILVLFSPPLEDNSYKKHSDLSYYKKVEEQFAGKENIKILYLDTFFTGINVLDIRYDTCCHFNEKGHKIIAEKLYEYIKTNKLLDEKCY